MPPKTYIFDWVMADDVLLAKVTADERNPGAWEDAPTPVAVSWVHDRAVWGKAVWYFHTCAKAAPCEQLPT
jgi:hypothetical protein